MTKPKIRLVVIVNNEIKNSWDLNEWDLDRPMSWAALISEIAKVIKYAKEDADAPS